MLNQSVVGEARLFSKDRHLRGLKSGSGNSGGESSGPPMNASSVSSQAAANDHGAAEQTAPSRSWPFAYALGLALIISALLWAVIAAVIHYF